MSNHASLSASGSAKWLSCSASLAAEYLWGAPDKSSDFADEGTAAHELVSFCLENDIDPRTWLGDTITVNNEAGKTFWEVTEEMVEAAEVYIQYIKGLNGSTVFVEKKVDYSHLAPEGFGTSDCIVETVEKVNGVPTPTLYVIDFKYGKGVRVDAFENSQGMLYALGGLASFSFLLKREIKRVVVVIVQPRIDHIGEYEISVDDLLAWGENEVKPKAKKAYDILSQAMALPEGDTSFIIPKKSFVPTEKGCKWCKFKDCKKRASLIYEEAVAGFTDLTAEEKADLSKIEVTKEKLKNPAIMSNEEYAAVWNNLKLFETWANTLEEIIAKKIGDGEYIPGLKLESKPGNRKWALSDEEVIKALRTAGLQKKDYEKIGIISPTDAEKIIKKVKPEDHQKRYEKLANAAIIRPEGAPKLVKDNSPQLKAEATETIPESFLD